MVDLSLFSWFEIISGLIFWWVGIYLLTRNPSSHLSWIVFGFLFSFGIIVGTDPILRSAGSFDEYLRWQKITDWPLFFSSVFIFHTSLISREKRKIDLYLLWIGYVGALAFTLIDIRGGLILKETVIRFSDYRRADGFAPGVLLAPSILFSVAYQALASIYLSQGVKRNFYKYFLPTLGTILVMVTALWLLLSFYVVIPPADFIFSIFLGIGVLLFVYSIIRYHLFASAEKIIFDKNFAYRSIGMFIILITYLGVYSVANTTLTSSAFAWFYLFSLLVLVSHSFYDWFITYVNDIVYNRSYGLSVVSDREVGDVIKNLNQPERLEENPLMRLHIVNNKTIKAVAPVDALQLIVKESIEHFKPESDPNRRTKKNLKYHLLKMIAFDEAEEGQILWELGFEEYPLRIMTKESSKRPPLFQITSPSDYTYTSRNAYLALKKEAIHDVAWRISYLEKLSRGKKY